MRQEPYDPSRHIALMTVVRANDPSGTRWHAVADPTKMQAEEMPTICALLCEATNPQTLETAAVEAPLFIEAFQALYGNALEKGMELYPASGIPITVLDGEYLRYETREGSFVLADFINKPLE